MWLFRLKALMSVMSRMPAFSFCAFCRCRDLSRLTLAVESREVLVVEGLSEVRDRDVTGCSGGGIETCTPASMGVTTSSSSHSSQSSGSWCRFVTGESCLCPIVFLFAYEAYAMQRYGRLGSSLRRRVRSSARTNLYTLFLTELLP